MTVGAIVMLVFGFGVTVGGAAVCIRRAMNKQA